MRDSFSNLIYFALFMHILTVSATRQEITDMIEVQKELGEYWTPNIYMLYINSVRDTWAGCTAVVRLEKLKG